MATVTKEWTNGDLLTLVTSAGGIAVSSAENLTGADREMTIRVQTTNQGTKAFQDVLIKQLMFDARGFWIHKDTGVKTYFDLDDPSITGGIMISPSWGSDCSEVNIPEGVTSLEDGCFNSSSLTSITLPESVTSLGDGCFGGCPFTSINIPESVTSIGGYCFAECESLTSITLPESLTSIGDGAFYYCTALSLVTFLPTVPPSLASDVFYGTHANLIIKVPAQSVNAYKTATNWNSYASIISAI